MLGTESKKAITSGQFQS